MRRLVLGAALLAACEGGARVGTEDAGPRVRGSARVGGEIVSTVDGHPIDVETVARAAREAEVAPELALSRLQDEALLAAAAERAGFGDDPEVRRATRRAAVQVLLARTVEAEITADAIDPAELEASLDAAPARFDRPERRRSTHALAAIPDGAPAELAAAAEAHIRALHAELARASDPAAALTARRHRPTAEGELDISVEDVPPLAQGGDADASYLDAVFAVDEVGLVPAPVRSALGWHAIVVTEVVPAWRPSREEALAVLRDERLAALRAQRLEAIVRELAAGAGVSVEPGVIQRTFADPSFLGGAE